jgi:hypothetical protein
VQLSVQGLALSCTEVVRRCTPHCEASKPITSFFRLTCREDGDSNVSQDVTTASTHMTSLNAESRSYTSEEENICINRKQDEDGGNFTVRKFTVY